ncbi:MAG: branched-chain amino acid ABC transporter substrate-binding protein [Anaerolineae bacterium]
MQNIKLGDSMVKGIRLALAERDHRAGDYEIELVVKDGGLPNGQWDPDIERQNAEAAVSDPDVMAYIGPLNSGAAKISIPITNQAGLLQISPSNTWPGLTKVGFLPGEPGKFYPTGRRNYFRTAPTDDLQAPAAVRWAQDLGFHSVYILDDGEAYGKGLADLFEATAIERGLDIRGHETITDISVQHPDRVEKVNRVLEQIIVENPDLDLIFYGGFTPNGAPLIVRQMQALGIAARFMGPDAIVDTAFIEEAGPAAEGVLATLVGVPPGEWRGKGETFYNNYLATYQTEPEAYAQFAYDAAQVILLAIEQANVKDRTAILNAVGELKKVNGAAGIFEFDPNGDTDLHVVSGNIVSNGRFVFQTELPAR